MDDERIARWRLRSLRLSGPPADGPEDALGWLCAVQSQDFGPAKWSIAMRTQGTADATMDRLVTEGAILRTHVLRPTWHFVLPSDIRWLLELTGPRIQARTAPRYRSLGLDPSTRARATDVLADALAGDHHLTRQESKELWERAGIDVDGQRLPYLLMHAELERVICSGELRSGEHTYALLEERVSRAGVLSGEAALTELTRRYFTGHGPATTRDFQAWSSLTMAQIREGLALAGDALEDITVGDRTYWYGEAAPAGQAGPPTAHLLHGYDECIMGYHESRWVIDVARLAVAPRRQSVSSGVVVVDGQIAGRWKRTPRARTVVVEVGLYAPLTAARTAALEAEARRYGAFLGVGVDLLTTRV